MGKPIAAARVGWALQGQEAGGSWLPDFEAGRTTPVAVCDENGRFLLPDGRTAAAERAWVWAAAPGRLAQFLPVGRAPAGMEFVLEEAAPTQVRVEGPEGPLGGARVELLAAAATSDPSTRDSSFVARPWALREYETDADGSLWIERYPDEVYLRARLGDLSTRPWRGVPKQLIVLQAAPIFIAEGQIPALYGTDLHQLRVSVRDLERELGQPLAWTRVAEDGSWALNEIPAFPARKYVFRLAGPGVVPDEVWIEEVQPFERQRIDFRLRRGLDAPVRVVDVDDQPVGGVEVRLFWNHDGPWNLLTSVTDEAGRAVLRGAPTGEVFFRLHRSGRSYVHSYGSYQFPSDAEQELELTLPQGGVLTGRCTHQGEALRDFWITCGQGRSSFRVQFVDAQDGRFRLEVAPLGPVRVFATSDQLPRGEPAVTVVPEEGEAWVELELPLPKFASGRVIDAESGEAIAGAEIEAIMTSAGNWERPWGPGGLTDEDGRFEDLPIAPARTGLQVSAPGFASAGLTVDPGQEERVDCGLIALTAMREVQIQLLSKRAVDFHQFKGWVNGSRVLFDADGVGRVEGMAPGKFSLSLDLPDGAGVLYWLEPEGPPWVARVEVDTERSLAVRADPGAAELPPGCEARIVHFNERGEYRVVYQALDEEGKARFNLVFADSVVVQILDSSSGEVDTIGSALVKLSDVGQAVLRVPVENKRPIVRLVDTSGKPIAGAEVWVMMEPPNTTWFDLNRTDAEGCFSAHFPLPDANYLMNVGHEQFGRIWNVPLPLPSLTGSPDPNGSRMEVRLDPRSRLRFRLLDRDFPLGGTRYLIEGRMSGGLLEQGTTRADGSDERERVEPRSRVEIVIEDPRLWPVRVPVPADGGQHDLQVRRRGGLQVEVSRLGQPVAGCRIQLWSREFETEVTTWLEAGQVLGGTVTDARGRLSLEGVPNGEYDWTMRAVDGSATEGSLWVQPGAPTPLPIEIE